MWMAIDVPIHSGVVHPLEWQQTAPAEHRVASLVSRAAAEGVIAPVFARYRQIELSVGVGLGLRPTFASHDSQCGHPR